MLEVTQRLFTLKEKRYLLDLLRKENRRSIFRLRKKPPEHQSALEKLEQMIRNEQVNRKHL